MTIRPMKAELFLGDERTYRHDEAHSRFSEFWESPQKVLLLGAKYTKDYISILPSFCYFSFN